MRSGSRVAPEGWPFRAFSRCEAESCARRKAQLSPAGPAPTIKTSVSRVSRSVLDIFNRLQMPGGFPHSVLPKQLKGWIETQRRPPTLDDRVGVDRAAYHTQFLSHAAVSLFGQAVELLLQGLGKAGVARIFFLQPLVNLL